MVDFPIKKTEDVARAWATQDRPKGKAASAFFRGTELFSYSTRIGKIVPNAKGVLSIALVSIGGMSQSTAVVIGQARWAAKDAGLKVFEVAWPNDAFHDDNMRDYDRRIGSVLNQIERALKPEVHRATASRLLAEQKLYARTFGLTQKSAYTDAKITRTLSRKEREDR